MTAQLWLVGSTVPLKFRGHLPPAPELPELYQRWRLLYEALHARLRLRKPDSSLEIEFDDDAVTRVSEAEFRILSKQLQKAINQWLHAPGFLKIDQQLRTKLNPAEAVRVMIETADPLFQKLPWHLWQFYEDYHQAEIALSAQEYDRVVPLSSNKPSSKPFNALSRETHSVRILVVLGHSDGIDIQPDLKLLEQLPGTEMLVLKEPQRSELDRWLWDEAGWDILFFAGHSTSQAWQDPGPMNGPGTGQLFINPVERLSIEQLRNALKASIARGLKLAIFNSCDGLGLARALGDLHIPQMIVMREPVADQVAQLFLKHFLQVFSRGEALYSAVRQAREKLQGVEGDFPGASWLPVIYQNPTEVPMVWPGRVLPARRKPEPGNRRARLNWRSLLAVSLIVSLLVMGVRWLGGLQALELQAYDRLMRSRPVGLESVSDPNLLVVEITTADTNAYGYPLRDNVLANVVEILQQYQPQAIGLDLHRFQVRPPGREQLLAQFQKYANLYTVCSFGLGAQNIYGPPPELSAEQVRNQVGFSDLQLDGTEQSRTQSVRRQLLSYDPGLVDEKSDCTTPFSLSFHLAYNFLSAAGIEPLEPNPAREWQFGPVVFHRLATRTGGYQNLDGQSHEILINYRFYDTPAHRISLGEILTGAIEPDQVKDRIVLIGTTDPVGGDYFDTPHGSLPGVWIHAHQISQILQAVLHDRPLLWVLPQWRNLQWGDWLWVWGWAMVGGLMVWWLRSPLTLALAMGLSIGVLYQGCLFFLLKGGWMPLLPAVLALMITAAGLAFYRLPRVSAKAPH
ncbi:MAG: CHASE2 domain-containing protein [Cyanobacteria bacterium P01_G01_bin.38]